MRKDIIIVVLPAYNVGKTIGLVVRQIPKRLVSEIAAVDDGSTDNTLAIIKKLGIKYKRHSKNIGYGGSQKTLFEFALKLGADIIVLLHSDLQHDPKYIKNILKPVLAGTSDIVLGSRIRGVHDALTHGMPIYKLIANQILTCLQNQVLGLKISEYHTGYRAYRRKVLETLPFGRFSDDFIFDQQILLSACTHKFRISEVKTSCIYHKNSSSVGLSRSIRYGLGVLSNLFFYLTDKKRYY